MYGDEMAFRTKCSGSARNLPSVKPKLVFRLLVGSWTQKEVLPEPDIHNDAAKMLSTDFGQRKVPEACQPGMLKENRSEGPSGFQHGMNPFAKSSLSSCISSHTSTHFQA